MFKLNLEKAEEPEIKLPTSTGSSEKQESSRKASTSTSLTSKAFDCVDHNKLLKILQEMVTPDHLTRLLRNLYAGYKEETELYMEQCTGSNLGKEYVKAVYCQPAYLTYMQSTSCEMPCWMKNKPESRLPGKISVTSDMQMTLPLYGRE